VESPAPNQPYEVRCHRCQCSFAPGTKQCLHCGGPLGALVEFPFARGPGGAAAEEPEVQVPSFARAVLWLLSAAVAIALSALQTCGR
jgi:hypothetical protein